MAHDEQRAAVRAQQLQQPVAGVGVEVVRRLVEQEQLTAGEEDAHELEPPALTTGERAEGEVEAIVGEPDARRELAHLRLGRVAAFRLELLLGAAEEFSCSPATASSIAIRAFSSRSARVSSPRPESTCARQLVSSGTASDRGSCER